MPQPTPERMVDILLNTRGRTYSDELSIDVQSNSSEALFQLLCVSLLFSAYIDHYDAMHAARELFLEGWTTPRRMKDSTWRRRADALDRALRGRNLPELSHLLVETADDLIYRYRGNIQLLREQATRDVAREHRLLEEFPGVGHVGAEFFLREVQAAWEEVYPFAGHRALLAAEEFGLPTDAGALSRMVRPEDFARLSAALERTWHTGDYGQILAAAGVRGEHGGH